MALVCLVGIGAILAGATLYGRARALERERDQLEAQQAERRRIYDEAHDRVYNRLRGLGFQAQVALQDPSRMRTTLAAIDPALRQVVEELQAIIQPLEETYPDSQREA